MIDLRFGAWQDALQGVDKIDSIITDPPYGARTHRGHNAGVDRLSGAKNHELRSALSYSAFTPRMVEELVAELCPRVTGWWCAMTSHDLVPSWESALEAQGMYVFAPLPIIQKRARLGGDGPASWANWMIVARRRNRDIARWRTLPGMYEGPTVRSGDVTGAKPIDMMRTIVRDYTRPGWLVVDPFAGSGTTLLAAAMEGRSSIGCEIDPATYQIASQRLHREYQATLFP